MNKKEFKVVLFLFLVIIAGYWGIWRSFFQQDEWYGIAKFYLLENLGFRNQLIELYTPMFKNGLAHFLPFLPIVNFLKYSIFGLNFEMYSMFSILTHLFASFLTYLLIRLISKNDRAALIGATFFAVMPNSSQTVSWVATSVPTQFAFIFSTTSLLFWFHWIEKSRKKYFILSFVFLIVSIGFKETSLFLFIFMPVSYVYIKRHFDLKLFSPFFFAIVFYLILRLKLISVNNTPLESFQNLLMILVNAFSNYFKIAFKGVSQSFIPQEIFYLTFKIPFKLFELVSGRLIFDPYIFEEYFLKPVMYFIGLVIFIYILKRHKPIYAIYIISTFIPIAFINTGELSSAFLSPRSLYMPLLGVAGIIGDFSQKIAWQKNKKSTFLLVVYFLILLLVLKVQNHQFISTGTVRRQIVEKIRNENPIFEKDVIFLIESDTSYYGLSEKMPPFQSGFGQTLVVWLYKKAGLPKEFLKNDFLWDIKSQGFKRYGDRGFGYFRDKSVFLENVTNNKIPIENVISYKWIGSSSFLLNTTYETRLELKNYVQKP